MSAHGFMTISDAASRSGVSPKTIRFYEESGLIAPAKRQENRYRMYDETDIETLRFVHGARSLGFSVKETGELLAFHRNPRRASREVKRLVLAHLAALDRKIAELTEMRSTIAAFAERCHGDQRPQCSIIEGLATQSY